MFVYLLIIHSFFILMDSAKLSTYINKYYNILVMSRF